MTPLRRRMIDDMTLCNLAPKTIQAYVKSVARFALYFNRSPEPVESRLTPSPVLEGENPMRL